MRKLGDLSRSTIFKVSAVFALILLSTVGFMGGFVFWSTVGFMDRQTNVLIETDIEGLAEIYRRDGLRGLITTIESRIERDPVRSSIYLVTDSARAPVVGNISAWPDAPPDQAGWIEFGLTERSSGHKTRARTRPFLLRGGVNLLVGRDIRNLLEMKSLIERALVWGMGIATIVGIVAALSFSRRVGRRLDTINETSREVMKGNFARRVPIVGNGDDLDELALRLNAMLDEIQQLLNGIEHVSDNIAHDLRTPLSRLRNRLSALLAGHAENRMATDSIESCVAEVDRLLATFNALLRIAKLEASGPGKSLGRVDLRSVVVAAVDYYQPVADARGISLRLESAAPVAVRGERELLLQAICNLLDNAIKFSPAGCHVDIELTRDHDYATLSVSDRGIGIKGENRTRIFERFYRGRQARDTEGSGLGLSMVNAICAYHGATISLDDNDPGLCVRVLMRRSLESRSAAA
ncbi:MAG: HAMP domain-containing sensor histidine kinase [Gammaproteobacteria bacterium]|nr:HAMP domain-containing sensor histidine kinase [Gammaproteobacteria bacterium]HJP35917.1 HAMP domain-containing sensor histidine kinase [Gammaproteobacteria bacterium]